MHKGIGVQNKWGLIEPWWLILDCSKKTSPKPRYGKNGYCKTNVSLVIFASHSKDGGMSWSKNQKVSFKSFS